MNRLLKIIFYIIVFATVSNCSKVLESIELELNSEDTATQEEFSVTEKTLTTKEAKIQNQSPYYRTIIQTGKGGKALTISEELALQSNFPEGHQLLDYKIGIGDVLSFSRLVENNHLLHTGSTKWPDEITAFNYRLGIGDTLALTLIKTTKSNQKLAPSDENQSAIITSQQIDETIGSKGRIGSDGSVLLLEVGRLEAKGKSLNELRSEVRNILIRNGISPRFQLEIVEFMSQKAYLTVNNLSDIIFLDDKRTTLRDILTAAEVGFEPGIITYVKLQRGNSDYLMTLRSIFSKNAPEISIQDRDHIFVEDTSSIIIEKSSTVGHDGQIVLEGIGPIYAFGLSLNELQSQISSQIKKLPDSQNIFQIKLKESSSQNAIVSIPGKEGGVIPIGNTPVALHQILTENGLSIDGKTITRITLLRNGNSYKFTLDKLLKLTNQTIYLQAGDRVITENLSYGENKVFILGGVTPTIYKIDPANRETLADVLFTEGGVLSSSSAKRSEVYLLRGSRPVTAYHLDAQNPTRLIVADAMELRPNDILYVAEKPIISFNRTLATIAPLRILLRDIQDENIP